MKYSWTWEAWIQKCGSWVWFYEIQIVSRSNRHRPQAKYGLVREGTMPRDTGDVEFPTKCPNSHDTSFCTPRSLVFPCKGCHYSDTGEVVQNRILTTGPNDLELNDSIQFNPIVQGSESMDRVSIATETPTLDILLQISGNFSSSARIFFFALTPPWRIGCLWILSFFSPVPYLSRRAHTASDILKAPSNAC